MTETFDVIYLVVVLAYSSTLLCDSNVSAIAAATVDCVDELTHDDSSTIA